VIATANDVYDIERIDRYNIRVAERRKYGWARTFSLNEAFELAVKLPDIIEEMLREGADDGQGQVDDGQAQGQLRQLPG
jgi:hypothetical protein